MKDCLQCAGLDLRFQLTRFSKLQVDFILFLNLFYICHLEQILQKEKENIYIHIYRTTKMQIYRAGKAKKIVQN